MSQIKYNYYISNVSKDYDDWVSKVNCFRSTRSGVIPRSEKEGTKPPYVCPVCSNHTHGNNLINRCNVINK
jgi:hypothetical protein